MRQVWVWMAVLLLGACTPTLSTKSLRFHQGIPANAGASFAIVAEGKQQNNLEFKHYAELVNTRLQHMGFKQAESLRAADYRITFSYGNDGGRQFVTSYPDYGWHGGIGTYGGNVGIGVGGPFYDPYRYRRNVESYVIYTYYLDLHMEDMRSGNKTEVFQGRVAASGDVDGISGAMPCMVAALFADFPGQSGIETQLSLPLDGCR